MRRLLVLAFALVASCGDKATAPQFTLAGTWNLGTINGAQLPYVALQSGADKAEILSDVLVLASTGTFTQTSKMRMTIKGVATVESNADAGTYTLNGSTVTLRWNNDGGTGTASWSGNTLTVTDEDMVMIYRR